MIIGITGTDGAGKGEAVKYLVERKGYTHYSGRELIVEEIKKRGLPVDRAHMRMVGNDLRRTRGGGVIVEVALERAREGGVENAVIESIRSLAEAALLKEKGGMLIAVDADRKLRYERVKARASESDHVSFEEFVRQEELELDDPDPHGMQKAKVMEMADYTILNNGTLEELYRQTESVLAHRG